MADALKRVIKTKRALAVNNMKVVQTTAMTTFRRRRSFGVRISSPPPSSPVPLPPPSLPLSEPSTLLTLLLGYECLRPLLDEWKVEWTPAEPLPDDAEKKTTGGSFQTTAGASLKATRFFRKSLSCRIMERRKQGSRQDPLFDVPKWRPDSFNWLAELVACNFERAAATEPLGPSDCRRLTRLRFLAVAAATVLFLCDPASLTCRLILGGPPSLVDDATFGLRGRFSPLLLLVRSPSCSK